MAAAPYMEQKATIDAIFNLAIGLYTTINSVPNVTGVRTWVKLLTQDLSGVSGGLLNVGIRGRRRTICLATSSPSGAN